MAAQISLNTITRLYSMAIEDKTISMADFETVLVEIENHQRLCAQIRNRGDIDPKQPQWPEWMKAGVRVVRGPDWQLPTQDPKEGDLGTLIYVPKKVGDNKVSVVWDSGKERMYQSGASGKYELRAFDIAQVGIVHTGIKCTTCSVNPIRGMRWSCLECNNVELCSRCYMDDKHNVKHSFVRRETLKSEPVSVGKRADAKPVQASGIFENSKVIRGPHWRYKNQDGGDTKVGDVKTIIPEKENFGNAFVTVKWQINNHVGEYRLGAEGHVDVVAFDPANGGQYYPEHLPLVGFIQLRVGDKVKVNLSLNEFKKIQEEAKSWEDSMKQCLNEEGTVIQLVYQKSADSQHPNRTEVQYKNGKKFVIMRPALYRVAGFQKGGVVRIESNADVLKNLQKCRGGLKCDNDILAKEEVILSKLVSISLNENTFIPLNLEYLGRADDVPCNSLACRVECVNKLDATKGKIGRVLKITKDGDLKVLVDKKYFIFSPACCYPTNDPKDVKAAPTGADSSSSEEDEGKTLRKTMEVFRLNCFLEGYSKLIHRSAIGEMSKVQQQCVILKQKITDFFRKLSEMERSSFRDETREDDKSDGLLLTKHSAESSDTEITDFAVGMGEAMANLKKGSDDSVAIGETIVELAGTNKLDNLKAQLKRAPEQVNFKVADGGRTALQLASHEGHVEIVKLLIKHNADLNLADKEGDTPLHYAVFGKQPDVVEILINSKGINMNPQNNAGGVPVLVAVNTADTNTLKLLVEKGCDVNIKDKNEDTPMHDAMQQDKNQPAVIETLLGSATCNFSIKNKLGFNVLHWACVKNKVKAVEIILSKSPKFVNETAPGGLTALHIAAFNDFVEIVSLLLEKGGADPDLQDEKRRTPLMLAVSKGFKRTVEVLIEGKANINKQDSDGDSALHVILTDESQENDMGVNIIYLLVEKGANINLKNNKGETPLDRIKDPILRQSILRIQQLAMSPALSQNGLRLPIHWAPMKVTDVVRVQLDPNDKERAIKDEYAMVARHFEKSMTNAEIKSIKRVQNALLWEHYSLRKKDMEGKAGVGRANEMHLYHGTVPNIVDLICEENFDFRIAGSRVGALYGQGTYFALEARYSDGYALTGDDNHKFMFVAKVLVGKTCLGNTDYKKPPYLDGDDKRKGTYDTCVNNVLHSTVFCVFDKNQYYPEYIIEYEV